MHPLGWDIHNQVLIKQIVTSANSTVHQDNRLAVYPNPTADMFFLQLPTDISLTDLQMMVYDQFGRLVMQKNGLEVKQQHDITQWQAGVYFIHVQGNGLNTVAKLLKIR